MQFIEWHPGDFLNLDIIGAEFAAFGDHQVVVHGLVHAPALGGEVEVDYSQRCHNPAADSGLLADLADRSILERFAGLQMTLGQRPHQVPAGVSAPDNRGPAGGVQDQPTRGGLLDGA